ncbi:MAG: phosphoenolpyruvate carboxykinase (ATP) [Comamonadaceae bacterium]|nr:phosphoenolpyruvate carboxykinase (ATP) [Comamonadaceae bacterium]
MNTGKHTARAANDKFVVREPSTEEHVWWGQYNRPFSAREVQRAATRACRATCRGATSSCRTATPAPTRTTGMPVRIITEHAWHSLFARNMFITPQTIEEYRRHVPDFTVIALPGFKGMPADRRHAHRTRSSSLNFDQRLCHHRQHRRTRARSRSRSSPC